MAQHERHQRPLRVGGARGGRGACADWGRGDQATQPQVRGVSAEAAESDEQVRGVSCGARVQSEPVKPARAQLHRVPHQPSQGTSLKKIRKTYIQACFLSIPSTNYFVNTFLTLSGLCYESMECKEIIYFFEKSLLNVNFIEGGSSKSTLKVVTDTKSWML